MVESISTLSSLRRSPLVQILVIGFLVVVLQVPVLLIANLVWEREGARGQAVAEISRSWGGPQEAVGPFLVVPYRWLVTDTDSDGKTRETYVESHATFLPAALDVEAKLATETLYRGVFEAPVYRAAITMSGSFDRPDLSSWGLRPEDVLWEKAQIALEVSDIRAIQNEATIAWGDRAVAFEPGLGLRRSERPGVHAWTGGVEGDSVPFRIELALNGSSSIRFAPLGRKTSVRTSGDWADPSFQGAWLPNSRAVQNGTFEAAWQIPYLGRNYPQSWWNGEAKTPEIVSSLFGLDLLTPTDGYRRTERSLKYEALFVGLTFLTIWLFEVLAGARVHIIQYGLIGAALCVFYLLELSLSEHLGFPLAYLLAAAAVVALVTCYAWAVLPSALHSLTIAATTAGLYAYLYVLIQLQDYALLVGSMGLLLILAVIMYATRRVDWYAPRAEVGGGEPGAHQL